MSDIEEILISSKQSSFDKAFWADVVSIIPIVGPITDVARAIDGIERQSTRRALSEIVDSLPILGLLPTNIMLYLDDKKQLPIGLKEFEKVTGIGSGK